MTRGRWAALVVVLLALVGAGVYGQVSKHSTTASTTGSTKTAPDLAPLRAEAALAPCPTSVGKILGDLTLPCLGGGAPVALTGAGTGRPTVVNLYGSWCPPCQMEYGYFVSLSKRAGSTVDLLGIDALDEDSNALQFAHDLGQHWPSVVDSDGTLLKKYGNSPPVTLFLDGAGNVKGERHGRYLRQADLDHDVRTYLGVTVPA